ncbi:hypothetical protein J1614_012240 [Plenodomus biglobosus]|nr:hypothetical protein J1614_012240 [Plenodomus biglobosus]
MSAAVRTITSHDEEVPGEFLPQFTSYSSRRLFDKPSRPLLIQTLNTPSVGTICYPDSFADSLSLKESINTFTFPTMGLLFSTCWAIWFMSNVMSVCKFKARAFRNVGQILSQLSARTCA